MSDVVLSERRGPVALLTLNRPDRLNAWTGELGERYYELLDECAADPDVRVIVVTGAGRGFCAGADMDDLQGIGGAARDETLSAARPSRPVYHATTLPKIAFARPPGLPGGGVDCVNTSRLSAPMPLETSVQRIATSQKRPIAAAHTASVSAV